VAKKGKKMSKIIILFLVLMAAGCSNKEEARETPSENIGATTISVEFGNDALCFYEYDSKGKWQSPDHHKQMQDVAYKLFSLYNKGRLMASPIVNNNLILFAEGCNERLAKDIFTEKEWSVSPIKYSYYMAYFREASAY
jgi:hypothetical protein